MSPSLAGRRCPHSDSVAGQQYCDDIHEHCPMRHNLLHNLVVLIRVELLLSNHQILPQLRQIALSKYLSADSPIMVIITSNIVTVITTGDVTHSNRHRTSQG